ncbi:MAG: hypothetical protein WC045_04380 [Patescibacteria group bacterium]
MFKKTIFILVILVFIGSTIGFALVSSFTTPNPDRVTDQIDSRNQDLDTDVLTNEPDNITGKTTRQISIEGVVKPLGSSIYQEGTHILSVAGVTVSLLEGTNGIDLKQYEGKNVKVSGTSRQTVEGDGSIMEVEKIEVVK